MRPEQVVRPGDVVQCKVTSVDQEKARVQLSLKRMQVLLQMPSPAGLHIVRVAALLVRSLCTGTHMTPVCFCNVTVLGAASLVDTRRGSPAAPWACEACWTLYPAAVCVPAPAVGPAEGDAGRGAAAGGGGRGGAGHRAHQRAPVHRGGARPCFVLQYPSACVPRSFS